MNKRLILAGICCVALTILLIASCTQAPQNSNQAVSSNANTANIAASPTPCDESSITTEMNKIIKDAGIEDQNNGNGNQYQYKNFRFKPVYANSQWVLVIDGGISDGKKDNPNSNSEYMEKVIKAVDQIIKKTCVFKAVFVKHGTIDQLEKGTLKLGDVQGFDWSSCDWPNVACANGECRQQCPESEPKARPGPGSNSNANSNVNTVRGTNANIPDAKRP